MTRIAYPLEAKDWTEAQLSAAIKAILVQYGWHVGRADLRDQEEQADALGIPTPLELPGLAFHDTVAWRSDPGWPDWTLIRRHDRRLIFAELKRESGKLKPRQEQVLDLLRSLEPTADELADDEGLGRRRMRVEVYVWRPSDYLSGAVHAVLR